MCGIVWYDIPVYHVWCGIMYRVYNVWYGVVGQNSPSTAGKPILVLPHWSYLHLL